MNRAGMEGSAGPEKEASAIDSLNGQVVSHNDQLSNILANVRGFMHRVVGADASTTQAADAPVAPGSLPALNDQLARQMSIIDELRVVVNALEKIA